MNIAYLINQYPKVSHSFIRREIAALERLGFEVQRFALRGWDAPTPDEADREELRVTRYVLRRGVAGLLPYLFLAVVKSPVRVARAIRTAIAMWRECRDRPLAVYFMYVAEASVIAAWVKHSGARHLHAHFGTNSAAIALLASKLDLTPFSFTVHGPDEFLRPYSLGTKVHGSLFTIAISSFGRSQLMMQIPFCDWHKIQVVHCGVERNFRDFEPQRFPSTNRLICVGRLCEAKGQLLLVEAAARLARDNVPFELLLAGDGPLRAQLQSQIDAYGMSDFVKITGWLSGSAVRKEILGSRAFVLPSFAEGLPVAIMEAMALRRPVLTTYIAGIPELVIPGQHGWLFPAGSLDDLQAAMRACLAAPITDLQKMGDNAYDRVMNRHSIDDEARKLAELLSASTQPYV